MVRGFNELSDEFCIELTTDSKSGEDKCILLVECLREEDISKVDAQLQNRLKTECKVTPEIRFVPMGTLPKTIFRAKRVLDKRLVK